MLQSGRGGGHVKFHPYEKVGSTKGAGGGGQQVLRLF